MTSPTPSEWPDRFRDVDDLDERLTRPGAALVDDLERVEGDIIILGASGKLGPTIARLAKRASPGRRVIGAARFREDGIRDYLEAHGIETISCDFLDRDSVARLPDVRNAIFMAGLSPQKFGQGPNDALMWAMNTYVPSLIAERFSRSNIVCFSTGCIYPFVSVHGGGATEQTPAQPPASSYAYSCVGRERIFEYFARKNGTPHCIVRLNYAIDMRYGVLHDIAAKILNGEAIDLTTGNVNVIWQGDAASMALRCLLRCSVAGTVINISGPETVSVRAVAHRMGELLGREPILEGRESDVGWLVNTTQAVHEFGYPQVSLGRLVAWTADWACRRMPSFSKKTSYEARPANSAASGR
jgi:nucleoside-diphosphate-sugar epimerase